MLDRWREVPPTAGLPLRWRDFLPARRSFEGALAELLNVPEVQVECSGTAALIVALTALRTLSSRRRVVIPAYTCPLVVLAIAHCGLQPVACDVRRGGFDFCPEQLEASCDAGTLAVLPTHLGGRVADVAAASNIARGAGAWVIEDAAQALGVTAAGTLGDAAFYSLAAGKGLTLFEGGVLIARDEALRRLLRQTAERIVPSRLLWETRRLLELAGYAALYRPLALRIAYGVPLRRALQKNNPVVAVGDDFSARIPLHRVGTRRRDVGANALERLPAFLEELERQARRRRAVLETIRGLTVIDGPGTWPFFMVVMSSEGARDAALSRLWTAGLGVSRLFIHALPDYPYLAPILETHEVPNARDLAARMLTISNSPWLRDADFERICSVLREVKHTTGPAGAR
jgi:perosamine synthetase